MTPRRVWCPKLPRSTPLPPIRPHASTCLERFGLRDTHRMQDWMLRLRRMAAREMPWVHPLDASLQTIPMGVFRMVPVALDMRPNRAIVGFDITSACGYAVAHGTIPDPQRLSRADAANHRLGQPGWAGYYRIDVGRPRSSMQAFVAGSTYHRRRFTRDEWFQHHRYQQIAQHVQRHHIAEWLALDDDVDGWPDTARHRLAECDGVHGVSRQWSALDTWLDKIAPLPTATPAP